MSGLSHEAKVRLTTLMAQFCGPSEAAKVVSDEFDVTVDRRTAWKFDASKRGCTTGPRYRQLFHEVRERWLNDMATVPIAQQGHRLRVLDRLLIKLEAEGDYSGALKVLEQAAKEAGRIFTDQPTVSVSGNASAVQMSADEARVELASRLEAALASQTDPIGFTAGQYPSTHSPI